MGGLFLVAKATYEIHHLMEGNHKVQEGSQPTSVGVLLVQIALLDMVFSLDSVITAIGMARQIEIMVAAVMISVAIMIAFTETVSRFATKHPSMKTLALSFLVMIGVLLIANGFGQHLPRAYVYFAMVFSLLVELINLRAGSRRQKIPVR